MPAPENPGSNETPETPGTEPSATIEVSDIDLWSNTAKVSVSAENIDDLKVYYGVKDSGNNDMAAAFDAYLCQEDPDQEGVAFLSANMVYTGDFKMEELMGTANFGKVFKWTARPTALKVTYKAKVGIVDKVGTYDKEGSEYKGKQDNSRIFAAVVDWSKQHGVTSGMGEPNGMWDPVKKTELEVCPLWS